MLDINTAVPSVVAVHFVCIAALIDEQTRSCPDASNETQLLSKLGKIGTVRCKYEYKLYFKVTEKSVVVSD